LQEECGQADKGRKMIKLALKNAEKARERWLSLMETDGGKVWMKNG
jgi:hypothetical protein